MGILIVRSCQKFFSRWKILIFEIEFSHKLWPDFYQDLSNNFLLDFAEKITPVTINPSTSWYLEIFKKQVYWCHCSMFKFILIQDYWLETFNPGFNQYSANVRVFLLIFYPIWMTGLSWKQLIHFWDKSFRFLYEHLNIAKLPVMLMHITFQKSKSLFSITFGWISATKSQSTSFNVCRSP